MYRYVLLVLLWVLPVLMLAQDQTTNDPYPEPIETTEGAIAVDFVEFAALPDIDGQAARVMIMFDEPGTGRLFVNDMRGPIYSLSYDGDEVVEYVDISEDRWGVGVNAQGRERGMQSFAFHPDFGREGAPGYGKFYTWTDSSNIDPAPDFVSPGGQGGQGGRGGGGGGHDTVLHEWTAGNPSAATYDGAPPRDLIRFEQPFENHNGGQIGFNTSVGPGDDDYGLLYVGVADGGSGGDPMNMAGDLSRGFGKILRIDPLGSDSANGRYGIPAGNPFASDGDGQTLGEIYAYGVRNPQRFAWDPENGNMFFTDIGQNTIEEISPLTLGANLGWNTWEGSFRYAGRGGVSTEDPQGDPSVTYPAAEYGQPDPLLLQQAAATGLVVYRSDEISALEDKVLWGDMPSGEIFYFDADEVPDGGQAGIRRVLLNSEGEPRRLLDVVQAKNREQGREPSSRADLRFGTGPGGQVFILSKGDGVIRLLVP
jgi:hypothetical protein